MSNNTEWDSWAVALKHLHSPESERRQPQLRTVDVVIAPPNQMPNQPGKGTILFHPQYQMWLKKQGICCASDVLNLRGEIVSGHADRHVVRIELTTGTRSRVVFLKREHVVGYRARWRNWQAGFGFISRCEREAMQLQQLDERGLPAPQWLAYGSDEEGRAFLLVDELHGCVDLRAYLSDNILSLEDRRNLFSQLARTIAEYHRNGFVTPDLCVKHLLINRQSCVSTLIDWQSAPKVSSSNSSITEQNLASLATLHASLAEELATTHERIRFLIYYFRAMHQPSKSTATNNWKNAVHKILQGSEKARRRTSIQLQRMTSNEYQPQRLVWLADEAVVAIPEIAEIWPTPAITKPYYPAKPEREWVELPNGTRAQLIHFATSSPFQRVLSKLRERPWRSPAAHAARILFHLQHNNIPAPRLLAYGQRMKSLYSEESFLLSEPCSGIPLKELTIQKQHRIGEVINSCAKRLKQLHEAGCRPVRNVATHDPAFVVDESTLEIKIGSALAIQMCKKITTVQIQTDIEWLCLELNIQNLAERARVTDAYFSEIENKMIVGMEKLPVNETMLSQ